MDSDLETEFISLITQLLFMVDEGRDGDSSWRSKVVSSITEVISLVNTMDLILQPKPESELMSLITQTIFVFNSMDLHLQPKPLSEFISLISQKISLGNSLDSDSNTKLDWDLTELYYDITLNIEEEEPELMSVIHKIFSLVISLNSKSGKFISLCPQVQVTLEKGKFQVSEEVMWESFAKWHCLPGTWLKIKITGEDAIYFCCVGCNGKNHDEYKKAPVETKHHFHRKHSLKLVSLDVGGNRRCSCCYDYLETVFYCCLSCNFAMNMACVKKPPLLSIDHLDWHENTLALFPRHASFSCDLCAFADSSYPWESELISLITQLMFLTNGVLWNWPWNSEAMSLITQIISLVSSIDLNSHPKPKSELMSLTTQTISVFTSMDMDSQPKPLSKFISLFSYKISLDNYMYTYRSPTVERELMELFEEILSFEPESELMSLIHKVFSLVIFINIKSRKFVTLCPQVQVTLEKRIFQVSEKFQWRANPKWECFPEEWLKLKFTEDGTTNFGCLGCNGKNHEEYIKAPLEIKHHLHPRHSLQLVLFRGTKTRKCYCCDEDLPKVFYCCLSCDLAMRVDCAKKPPLLSIDHPKWHKHHLSLFPRHASLTCNLCPLADASSPIYMCPNCDFVVYLRCINLPRVIRISRHCHRISFTPSFDQGELSCGVCRRKIDNDYGGYSCRKDGYSYAAHSKCATQSNVWDKKELEGEPEEEIKEVDPFVKISDGIIQHFTHQHHHLRLDENTKRDYDENKQCQTCHTPIYFGNFYSCMQCDFILHEECANLSRKIYHQIHPHLLTLGLYNNGVDHPFLCGACFKRYPACIYYKCGEKGCFVALHVKCATVPEPLFHESHTKPLLLTSKPEEEGRICSVCNESRSFFEKETFNCIECDFALCYRCATLPQKVRYKHDKHMLTLSYGDKTSTMTYWCESCGGKVNPKKRFYVCDENCCITLHIECLLGQDLYMKPAQSAINFGCTVDVLPNNHHMSRPFCSICEKRCPQKTILKKDGSILCSSDCLREFLSRRGYRILIE